MEENEKTSITIDGEEYRFEDMKEDQQAIINHIVDLDRKLNAARFNIDQLNVSRDAFFNMLKTSLEAKE